MARYEPPNWGVNGRNVFGIYLEVIKGGVVVEKLEMPISKDASCVVAGRMDTHCDLVLAHPSISRVHAALQFDQQGALFLCDLNSTHGCFVNKKRVKTEDYERLHIGDVLCFGESTRLYAVCGPEELLPAEYESLNLAKFREKLEKKRETSKKKKEVEDRGASWGFGEDAEEDSEEEVEDTSKEQLPDYLRNLKEEEPAYTSSVSKADVSEKDQRLYQQLQTRIRKMENLKLEKSRILAKQNQLEGLSEGQQRTLDRNEQRIESLMKEIDDLEMRIHAKNDQRSKTGKASGSVARKKRNVTDELYGYSSDEDDFYDRTKANQQKFAARKQKLTGSSTLSGTAALKTPQTRKTEVLTAESIQANVKKLEGELANINDELTVASAKSTSTREESKTEKEVDSLDSFMAETTSRLHVNTVDAIKRRKLEVEAELKRQRQLLAVATPALAAVPVQTKAKEEPSKSSRETIPSSTQAPSDADANSTPKTSTPKKPLIEKEAAPIPVNKKQQQPASPKASNKSPERLKAKAASPAVKKRRISGPAMGPPPQGNKDDKQKLDPDVLEGGDQVWVPPANQSGDGRTSLNDKYGY